MTLASVVIPWRGGCPHRERAYAWVRDRLTASHPSWEVVEGLGGSPWCKAAAVEDGLSRATGGVLIVFDADVWVPNLAAAVAVLEAGAPWVVPHMLVHRFTEAGSERVYAGEDPATVAEYTQDPYHGWPGGGGVVMWRKDYGRACLDRRYQGWGSEDDSFALSLREIVGPEVRLEAPLYHLWHPPQPRLTRIVGSKESEVLWRRYRKARGRPAEMAALIAEGRVHAGQSCHQSEGVAGSPDGPEGRR